MTNHRKIVDEILNSLPWQDRMKVIEAGKKYRKLKPLTSEIVEELYYRVLAEKRSVKDGTS